MPMDLAATREALRETTDRIVHLEVTNEKRDRKATVRLRVFVLVAALVVVSLLILGMQVRAAGQATDRNRAAIERSNLIREEEAKAACDRYNNSIQVDRFIINKKYDLVFLSPMNQTPERQTLLSNLRAEELNQLEELRPIRNCAEAVADATDPEN